VHRLLAVPVDRGRTDAEPPRDLLRLHVRGDEAQTFALAAGQPVKAVSHAFLRGSASDVPAAQRAGRDESGRMTNGFLCSATPTCASANQREPDVAVNELAVRASSGASAAQVDEARRVATRRPNSHA